MTTTTDKLAAALAALLTRAEADGIESVFVDDARAALAAYEAELATPAAAAGEHTPEPWAISTAEELDDMILGPESDGIADCFGSTANARRIVACVNACAGIPDAVLADPWQVTVKWADGDTFRTFKTGRDTE